MAFTCDLCSKRRQSGHNVSHKASGFSANLRQSVLIDGQPKRIRVCTRCLRGSKVQKPFSTLLKQSASHRRTPVCRCPNNPG